MIYQTHIPAFPLDKFIEIFIYYEGVKHAHNVDRFLPNGDTEILIDFHDTPQYIYDNETLKEIQACNHVWASGLRTEPITIPSGNNAAMMVIAFQSSPMRSLPLPASFGRPAPGFLRCRVPCVTGENPARDFFPEIAPGVRSFWPFLPGPE